MRQRGFTVLILVIVVLVLCLLTISGILFLKNYYAKFSPEQSNLGNSTFPSPTPQLFNNTKTKDSTLSSEIISDKTEVKFTGKITNTNNGCWVDANCSLTVNGKVILIAGGLTPDSEDIQKGQLIGYNYTENTSKYIGKTVEVYAKIIDSNSLTIEGKTDYYVKVLDN